MPNVSSNKGTKRKMEDSVSHPPSKSSKVLLLGQSLLLLKIPEDINTSLPVWEAIRSQQLDIAWTVSPYGISIHLTPVTSNQKKTTASSRGERTSAEAQTLIPSSILQPQTVIQFVTQQPITPQNTSYALLTFPQNNNQPPQQIPPNPIPTTSIIVSLPVIITQQQLTIQPSTHTKQEVQPFIQAPTACLTKQQARSEAPVPSPFHTKSSSDVQICDNFLLSLCRAGRRCKMHHTPYPFHWQLWCASKRQWIDFPLHSQVLLERMYSNVNQRGISIKDGPDRYRLDFNLMELDNSSMYDEVRRLTNSDSLFKNPYFPNKWKIYWWNNFNWVEYTENVSTLLLMKMSEREPECSFLIGSQEYKVDFITMCQTNVTTGFQREVRCRPAYRSPESMQPYLRTGIQTDSIEPVGDPPAANFNMDPLEEFSSWYPPVWCLGSKQDLQLVDLPAGSQAYKKVKDFFFESLYESEVDIVSILQVQNLLHWDKYQRHKAYIQKQHPKSKEPLERHLFHGTTKRASEDICHNNFDPRIAGVNGTSHGYGSYFATKASISYDYSAKAEPDEVRHMFLAKVLVGKATLGKHYYRRPPPLNSRTKQHHLYDSCVDAVDKPTMFVVFDSCQCYPYYLIKYKDLPEEVELS